MVSSTENNNEKPIMVRLVANDGGVTEVSSKSHYIHHPFTTHPLYFSGAGPAAE